MLGIERIGRVVSQSNDVVKTTEHVPSGAGSDVLRNATLNEVRLGKPQGLPFPALADRSRMSSGQRLRILNEIGFLPDDANAVDCDLAERTEWWGKRIDPKQFWSDKVLWYDRIAEQEARRRGRGWPPMPYDDPSVSDRSDVDRQPSGHGAEGPTVHYVSSERESVFWSNFVKTHPHPPLDIEHWQTEKANSWLGKKNIIENEPTVAAQFRVTQERLDRMLETHRRDASLFGYPPECLTPDAYRWSHITQKRKEYEAIRVSGQDTDNVTASNFFRSVHVDRKYITEPLSAEDVQAANAWKVAYLRRLRQEKTDELYINAYMQAWNLASNDVFCNPLMTQ
jgi:hypothetical protein